MRAGRIERKGGGFFFLAHCLPFTKGLLRMQAAEGPLRRSCRVEVLGVALPRYACAASDVES